VAFEKIYLIAKIEIDLQSAVAGAFGILSDTPGNAIAPRVTVTTPICGRRVVQKRLPYFVQGHLFTFTWLPVLGPGRLYGVRVWARELPTGAWQWYALPVVSTPNEWASARLQIPETPDGWTAARLEVPPSAAEWSSVALRMPATPDEWGNMALPIRPTPPVPEWVTLEVDQ
jgi:hypothetical protein